MGAFGVVVMLGLAGVVAGVWLFSLLMLSRAIFGAFGSASSPAAQAYIADRTTRMERTEQLAALSAAFAFGQAFGPALCAALAAATSFVVLRFLPENTPPKTEQPQRRADWSESFALITDRRLSGFLIYGFGLSLIAGITVQVFGLFTMDRLNVSGEQGAEFAAAGFMVNALAFLATQLGILPRLKLAPRLLMAWGAGLLAGGVALQIFAPSLGAILVASAVQGMGAGLARAGFAGGSSIAVQPHEQGAAAGLVVAINGAGFVFSPLFGGVVYERVGITAPLYITVAILIAMLAFTLRSRRLRDAIGADPPSEPPTPTQ
jgi:MFS family permease